jgi:NTP pyrophosphatase (non-canonical NTP hydrolase)
MKEMTYTVLNLIDAEREVQDAKGGVQDQHNDDQWYRILAEEFGEIAKALNDKEPDEALEAEIIQTAAVCVAWLEARSRRALFAERFARVEWNRRLLERCRISLKTLLEEGWHFDNADAIIAEIAEIEARKVVENVVVKEADNAQVDHPHN